LKPNPDKPRRRTNQAIIALSIKRLHATGWNVGIMVAGIVAFMVIEWEVWHC